MENEGKNKISMNHLPYKWLEGGIVILDLQGRIKKLNVELKNWLGAEEGKLINRPLSEVLNEYCGVCSPPLPELSGTSEEFVRFVGMFNKVELVHWLEFNYVKDDASWVVYIRSILPPVSNMTDDVIDEYLRRDSAFRETFIRMIRAEARLHNLINYWPGLIFSQRADFTFSFVSPQVEEFTGIPSKLWQSSGECFWNVVHEADIEIVKQQLKRAAESPQGASCSFRIRNIKTGKVFYVHEHRQAVKTESGMLLGYEGVWLDITRQTIAEKRLSTASWKEALGILTMGLAHDFSNVMSGIHGLSESFAAHLEPDHPFREGLELIKNSSMQASQIVHRIINLHHGRAGERSYCDLNQIVLEMTDLIKKVVPRRLKFEVYLSQEQLPVYIDPVEFRQVVINMALNAVDAMPREGRITFTTGVKDCMESSNLTVGNLAKFPAVYLSIEDTGYGIKESHLEMIFDPFFTTKPLNKGSGLGLYNARLFIEKHHGAITVNTSPGKGTKFTIWLPESDFTEAESENKLPNGRRHIILLISNNEHLLESTAEYLRIIGFVVVPCAYQEKAQETLESGEYKFSGVLFVVNGQRDNYGSLIRELRSKNSDLKIIIQITGRNVDEYNDELINCSDLTIYPDMSEGEMTNKLRNLFNWEQV